MFRRKTGAAPEPGVLQKDTIYPLMPFGYADVESFIAAGDAALQSAQALISNSGIGTVPLSSVQLLSPLLRPPRIFCVGLELSGPRHGIEDGGAGGPDDFYETGICHHWPGQRHCAASDSTQPDYEAELAVVIGQNARNVTRENWRECVFGYTILNDVSARDVQLATSQWTLGKSFPDVLPHWPMGRDRR